MLPQMTENIEDIMESLGNLTIPSGTWQLNSTMTRAGDKIDDLEAVKQSVYFILNTEKDKFTIYNWDYGIELVELIGRPIDEVMSLLSLRITEALEYDDRITDVTDFNFERVGHSLHVSFTVHCEINNMDETFNSQLEVTL